MFEPIIGLNHYFYVTSGGMGIVITTWAFYLFINSFIISKIQYLNLVLYLSS